MNKLRTKKPFSNIKSINGYLKGRDKGGGKWGSRVFNCMEKYKTELSALNLYAHMLTFKHTSLILNKSTDERMIMLLD